MIEVRLLLLERQPTNLTRMRDVSSGQILVGELSKKLGNQEDAESALLAALRMRKKIEARNPTLGNSYDLLPVYSSLANLAEQQKDWSAFKEYAEAGLEISRTIFERYPTNVSAAESLAVFLTKMADWESSESHWTETEKYLSEALSLRKAAAEASPLQVQTQRSLHVAFNRIGQVYRQQKRWREAREVFEASKRVTAALLEKDPGNLAWQRDLSVSYNRLGDCYVDENLPEKAVESYRDALRLRRSIAAVDPHSVAAQIDVVQSLGTIAEKTRSEADYQEAIDILERLRQVADLPKAYEEWLPELHQTVNALKRSESQIIRLLRYLRRARPGRHITQAQRRLGDLLMKRLIRFLRKVTVVRVW